MEDNYSVLMSVYYKENPEYLKQAIKSMLTQTVPTNDFVLVCDGPLTDELDSVIAEYTEKNPNLFQVIRLKTNQGLGNALNIGLQACRNNLIARMDSDDISVQNRCELQLKLLKNNQSVALCSGYIAEFENDIQNIESVRTLPTQHKEIVSYAKKRNPMNHMAVMFRKNAVVDSGNYIEVKLAEDYYLWVRMIQKGYQTGNIDKILVYARIGNGMFDRRGGIAYAKSICQLQRLFLKSGFISRGRFLVNCAIRIIVSIIPAVGRRVVYQKGLRNHRV